MKKTLLGILIMLVIFSIGAVYASNAENVTNTNTINENTTEGALIGLKLTTQEKLDEYVEQYGSESYGWTAFVLSTIRIYSIPFCFLGVAVSAIYKYVIGIRKLDTRDKGLYSMVGFVTIFVICQVMPLVFAIVVRGWRG